MPQLSFPWRGNLEARKPKTTLADFNGSNSKTLHKATAHTPCITPSASAANVAQRQKRISRCKRGIRVSRRLPGHDSSANHSTQHHQELCHALPHGPEQRYATRGILDNSQQREIYQEYTHVHTVNGPLDSPDGIIHSIPQSRMISARAIDDRSNCLRKQLDVKKSIGLLDPAVLGAVQRTMAQQSRLSSLVSRDYSRGKVGTRQRLSVPSRTSSRRKALNRFAKELEKYAKVASAAGKLPVITPTASEEDASLHTVEPLVPYVKEFEAAGLAVTAKQQKAWLPRGLQGQQPRRKSAAIDQSYDQEPHLRHLDGQYDGPTRVSTSRSGRRQASRKEVPVPSTKRRLPWLRRKQPTRDEELKPKQRIGTMIECGKGEWTISSPKDKVSANGASVVPIKLPIHTKPEETAKQSPHADLPAFVPGRQRQGTVHPNVSQYDKQGSANPRKPKQSTRANHEFRFRSEKNLAQSADRQAHARAERGDISLKHHHHPFFQHHHHSPIHRLHHVHGAPVTWIQRQLNDSSGRRPQKQAPTEETAPMQKGMSPVLELPYAWKYAVSNVSSLERALSAAQKRVEEIESEANRPLQPLVIPKETKRPVEQAGRQQQQQSSHKHHPLLAKGACMEQKTPTYSHPPIEPTVIRQHVKTGTAFREEVENPHSQPLPRLGELKENTRPITDETIKPPIPQQISIFTNEHIIKEPHDEAQIKSPLSPKAYSTEVLKENDKRPSQLRREVVSGVKQNSTYSQGPLEDLGSFFDTDDATIDDRAVLQGLQVAVRAAADDLYDALIRKQTGLRIRRFLADLKSIDTFGESLTVGKPTSRPRPKKQRSERSKQHM